MTVREVYILRVAGGNLTALDVPAAVLALHSRGRYPLEGDRCRAERLELADLCAGLAIEKALRDGRPLLVDGEGGRWTFREV